MSLSGASAAPARRAVAAAAAAAILALAAAPVYAAGIPRKDILWHHWAPGVWAAGGAPAMLDLSRVGDADADNHRMLTNGGAPVAGTFSDGTPSVAALTGCPRMATAADLPSPSSAAVTVAIKFKMVASSSWGWGGMVTQGSGDAGWALRQWNMETNMRMQITNSPQPRGALAFGTEYIGVFRGQAGRRRVQYFGLDGTPVTNAETVDAHVGIPTMNLKIWLFGGLNFQGDHCWNGMVGEMLLWDGYLGDDDALLAVDALVNTCTLSGGDADDDGVCDDADDCVNGVPACCDAGGDADGDAVCDDVDACLFNVPACCDTGDADGDALCDDADNCPAAANVDQLDFDGNGVGDACDAACVAKPPTGAVYDRSHDRYLYTRCLATAGGLSCPRAPDASIGGTDYYILDAISGRNLAPACGQEAQ